MCNEIIERLKKGAFLTVKDSDKVNTMTISWGNIGVNWREDIFVTLVRDSRYTKEFIDKNGKFTVTIPKNDDMKDALAFCGSKSGRDYDKIKECNLSLAEGKAVDVPHIACSSYVYECEVIYKMRMDTDAMTEDFKNTFYSDGDIHTFYFGKVKAFYEA